MTSTAEASDGRPIGPAAPAVPAGPAVPAVPAVPAAQASSLAADTALGGVMLAFLVGGWVFSKVAVEHMPPGPAAAFRTICVAAVLLAYRPRHHDGARLLAPVRSVGVWRTLALAVSGYFLYYALSLRAVADMGPAATGAAVGTLPVMTALLAALVFRQRTLTAGQWAGVLLSLAGVSAFLATGSLAGLRWSALLTGVVAAVGCTASYATYSLVFARHAPAHGVLPLLRLVVVAASLLGVPYLVWAAVDGQIDLAGLGAVAVLGAVLTAPTFIVSHTLLRRVGAVVTNAWGALVPLGIRLASWPLGFAGRPALSELAGLTVAAVGVLLVVRVPAQRPGGVR